jgi:hypothetical protein
MGWIAPWSTIGGWRWNDFARKLTQTESAAMIFVAENRDGRA